MRTWNRRWQYIILAIYIIDIPLVVVVNEHVFNNDIYVVFPTLPFSYLTHMFLHSHILYFIQNCTTHIYPNVLLFVTFFVVFFVLHKLI